MRAWQVVEHGEPKAALSLVDVELPEPGPGQVRLRVAAAALGFPDVLMCRGVYPLTPPLPFIPGQEVAGTVTAIGDGVGIAIGSRVLCVTSFVSGHGGFADEALAPERGLVVVPEWMSDADAAVFSIAYRTAWIGLVRRGGIQPGEWLVVLGAAGGTGSAAIELGVALGAHVIAVAGGQEKLEYCRRLGAEVLIDHSREMVPDAVMAATDGHGADLIYDPVGGEAATSATEAMANEGRLLLIGFASGTWPALSALDLVRRNFSAVGVFAGAYDRPFDQEMHQSLFAMAEDGRIDAHVTSTVPFTDLPAGLEALSDRAALGKYVLVP